MRGARARAARAGRPDGLTIVNFQGTQVMGQILGREGVEFDASNPVAGEEVERLVGELFRMPPPVLAKLKELLR